MCLHSKGYLAHTQLIAHKRIVTYLYTKYCSHILYLVILIGNKYLCIRQILFLQAIDPFYVLAKFVFTRAGGRKFWE